MFKIVVACLQLVHTFVSLFCYIYSFVSTGVRGLRGNNQGHDKSV